jgi:hypothetical protein
MRSLRLLAVLTLATLPQLAQAAASKPDKVSFDSFDQVELVGDFYDSGRGTKATTVLLVHKLGGERKQLVPLAEKLAEAGFAGLNFDLRGHGESTSVKPGFWDRPANLQYISGSKGKPITIDFKKFGKGYYPRLINDIAAAKYALERKNDARECNASDLVLVGAEDGATLLALWMATEWEHRRTRSGPKKGKRAEEEPQARDIAACVWLSMRGGLGSGTNYVPLQPKAWFNLEKVRGKEAFGFFYGVQDGHSARVAKDCFGVLKNTKRLSLLAEVKETKLAGHDLLDKDFDIETKIVEKYLKDRVLENRPSPVWSERDLKNYPLLEVPPRLLWERFGVRAP